MRVKVIHCSVHVGYNATKEPSVGCSECLRAFERNKFKFKQALLKKIVVEKKCRACGNLGKVIESNGLCLKCDQRITMADIKASNRQGIRQDMIEMDVPLRGIESDGGESFKGSYSFVK